MVSLSLDPPPSGRANRRPSRGVAKIVVAAVVLLAIAAGSFLLGRKTAQRSLPALPRAAAPTAPAATPPVAQLPSTAGGTAPAAATAVAPGPTTAAPAPVPAAAEPPAAQGPRRLVLTLHGPLEQSIADAMRGDRALAEELTQVVNRLLVWRLQVAREGRKGDRLEVLYSPAERVSPDAAPAREPVVEALHYTSQKLGKTFSAYRFKPDASAFARYYDAEGAEVEERLVDGPIRDYEQVTSLLRDGRRHKGVDFKTPVGSPVLAPFDGVVVRRNWHFSANGNCLEIADAHSDRHAIFLHLEGAPKEMQPGRKIKKGEQVALSGNSGHSTAPHLHYQLESGDGRILDPFTIHATRRLALEGAARGAFDAERKRLDGLLGATM